MSVIKPILHHVTIKTSKLGEMVDWYTRVIGVDVQFRDTHNAWMTNDAANHRIAFLAAPGLGQDENKHNHTGMHHSAFEYKTFADLMASYGRLKAEGIRPAFCLEHGLTTSIYYRDPEGNFVELQADAFGDWAESGEFMRTSPDFASNPIGFFFDPEKVFEAHEAGMDFKALQTAIRTRQYEPDPIPDMGLPLQPAATV